MANLELRNNEKDMVLAVINVYLREYGSSNDFVSLGYGGEVALTIGRETVAPVIGLPERRVKSRTKGQSFRAVASLKANLDRLILKNAHPGISENIGVSRTFHKDDRVPIDLSAESAVVIEANFTASSAVSLYDPNGNKGVLATDYTANAATGKIIALTAAFQEPDCSITYDYTALADEITYGGLVNCESEKELEVKLVCRTNECRLDEEDFVQHVVHIYRAETSGDFEYAIKPDAIDPVTLTFEALDDPTKPKGNRLFRHYHEKVAA